MPDSLLSVLPFPSNFTPGAITATYHIEGAWNEAGKGPSIWDTIVRQAGKTERGETADVTVDPCQRWPGDVALMTALGLNACGFSIAWPRFLPEGAGQVTAGLDFYDRLVDRLLADHIPPFGSIFITENGVCFQDEVGADGYCMRLGLAHVDFVTQRRTLKDSGLWYA